MFEEKKNFITNEIEIIKTMIGIEIKIIKCTIYTVLPIFCGNFIEMIKLYNKNTIK